MCEGASNINKFEKLNVQSKYPKFQLFWLPIFGKTKDIFSELYNVFKCTFVQYIMAKKTI